MWLEDITDPDQDDLTSSREEFAGWDPYVIGLCRQASGVQREHDIESAVPLV